MIDPYDPRDAATRTDLSAARLDRLRSGRVPTSPAAPRAVFSWALTAALLAFALGLIANPWFERSVRSHLPGFASTLSPTVADLAAIDARVAAIEARPATKPDPAAALDPAQSERLARVEGALTTLTATTPNAEARTDKIASDLAALTARIDATAAGTAAVLDSATATAARAQAMLVADVVRRQLSVGQPLGPLEPALRRNFAGRAAPQVDAIAALGAAPVTVAGLRASLAALRPAITGVAKPVTGTRGWWETFRDGLTGVVVRAAPSATATDPAARIDRADRDLVAGDVAGAVVEVTALPVATRVRAMAWLAAANRYLAGWRALAALDTMLLDPLPPPPGLGAAR
jgi:hypothetical protein